jgi:hypothetical protein
MNWTNIPSVYHALDYEGIVFATPALITSKLSMLCGFVAFSFWLGIDMVVVLKTFSKPTKNWKRSFL